MKREFRSWRELHRKGFRHSWYLSGMDRYDVLIAVIAVALAFIFVEFLSR